MSNNSPSQRLWYTEPAKAWAQALPVGNGRLGCMVFGSVEKEHLQLNEDSLWSGGAKDRINPDAYTAWQQVCSLMAQGRITEAEQCALDGMAATPCGMRAYQPLGDLWLDFTPLTDATAYERELDLNDGVVRTCFSVGGSLHMREVFASYPDNCLLVRLHTNDPQGMSFRARLERARLDESGHRGTGTLYFCGNSGDIRFAAALRVIACDGAVSAVGDTLRVKNAATTVLAMAAATSYREADPLGACLAVLNHAAAYDYATLRARHAQDMAENFHTMSLTLSEESDTAGLPTDRRLQCIRAGKSDAAFDALYFQYCRWLLFCSSRPGSLPANLQGIWNDSFTPAWDSKFTININLEMNYWPANICGLSACEETLFDLLKTMLPNGQRTAQKMYGCRGFVAHHNTDLWGDTAPQDRYLPATFWTMGAAWLCTHIWEHYLYCLDKDFLLEMFPVLEQSVLFFEDFLQKTSEGYYAAVPSVSPENAYRTDDGTPAHFCMAPAMDSQILHELFTGYLCAAQELSIENDVTQKAHDILNCLQPPQIGPDGRLLEWDCPYTEMEPGHRHISHLYALTPGHQISKLSTHALAAAAEKTLAYRLQNGGGHTGWSRAWIMRFRAHLYRGDALYDDLLALYRDSTFDNLMDTHPFRGGYVFQIDGNLGAAAAMTDCLVQVEYTAGHPRQILLLPALPAAWHTGCAHGLCLPNGLTLALAWQDGSLTQAAFTARRECRISVIYKGKCCTLELTPGQTFDTAPQF